MQDIERKAENSEERVSELNKRADASAKQAQKFSKDIDELRHAIKKLKNMIEDDPMAYMADVPAGDGMSSDQFKQVMEKIKKVERSMSDKAEEDETKKRLDELQEEVDTLKTDLAASAGSGNKSEACVKQA